MEAAVARDAQLGLGGLDAAAPEVDARHGEVELLVLDLALEEPGDAIEGGVDGAELAGGDGGEGSSGGAEGGCAPAGAVSAASRANSTTTVARTGDFVSGMVPEVWQQEAPVDPVRVKRPGAASAVVDVVDQAPTIGDLHHALAAGVMTVADVHAELGQVVAGVEPGRRRDDEIIAFDSTGMALQDAAAAALVYERAPAAGRGLAIDLGGA